MDMLERGTKEELIKFYNDMNLTYYFLGECSDMYKDMRECWKIENQINDCYTRGFKKFKIFYHWLEEIPCKTISLNGEIFVSTNTNEYYSVKKQRWIKTQEIEITD